MQYLLSRDQALPSLISPPIFLLFVSDTNGNTKSMRTASCLRGSLVVAETASPESHSLSIHPMPITNAPYSWVLMPKEHKSLQREKLASGSKMHSAPSWRLTASCLQGRAACSAALGCCPIGLPPVCTREGNDSGCRLSWLEARPLILSQKKGRRGSLWSGELGKT